MKEENEKDFPYVNVRSEPPQYCKVISLQLNKFKKLILCCRAFFFLFEKWIFEIEFKCHKIYAYKVYNLEGFFFFFFFFYCIHRIIWPSPLIFSRKFSSPQKETWYPFLVTLRILPTQPLETINLLPVSVLLPDLDIASKQEKCSFVSGFSHLA